MPRVLITGANGFLGSALCRAAAAHGWEVLAVVRDGADVSALPGAVHLLTGDFTDATFLADSLAARKPDAIIHAAAVVSNARPDPAESWRVNVEGTRTLLDEARRARVARFLYVSSMSAHAANKAVYGASKLLAERLVRESPLAWTILKPSLIYGPGGRGIFARMRGLIERLPVVPLVGFGFEPVRPVHVDDVAEFALCCLEDEAAVGATCELGGPEDWCFHDVVGAIAEHAVGRRVPLVPVPLPVCRVLALLTDWMQCPPITLDNVEGVARAVPVDDRAARALGFAPRSFAEGLRDAGPPPMMESAPETKPAAQPRGSGGRRRKRG